MKLFLTILISKIWNVLKKSGINRLLDNNLNIKIRLFLNRLDPRVTVMIGLSYFCQCNCLHCGMANYKKDKESELTTDEWLGLIDGLSSKNVKQIYFFGGEPLLRNDIFQLIKKTKKGGFRSIIDTNGHLLTEEMVEKLKIAGLDLIEVSIDSADPKTHDALRKLEGLFEKATTGIKMCLKRGIFCILSTYVTEKSIKNGDFQKIILLAEKLGVNYLRVLAPVAIGKWLKKEEVILNKNKRKQLKNIIKNSPVFLEDDYCLSANKKLIYISPYGEVQPCCYIPFTFGNIKEEPLEEILKRMWKHPLFRIKTKECLMNNEEFRRTYLKLLNLPKEIPVDLSQNSY